MSAHLNGPWRIVDRETLEDGSVYPRRIETEVGEYQICLLESANMAALGYDRTPAEQERDRLIAAAPDLLKALQRIINNPEARIGGDIRAEANAAINKAIGNAAPEGLAPLPPSALASARAFGAGLDEQSLEQGEQA